MCVGLWCLAKKSLPATNRNKKMFSVIYAASKMEKRGWICKIYGTRGKIVWEERRGCP